MGCSRQELQILKKRLEELIQGSSSSKTVNLDNLNKRQIFITLDELVGLQANVYRQEYGFVIFENRHLIYINIDQIKDRIYSIDHKELTEPFSSILNTMLYELNGIEELKTRNKDKLMFVCPVTFNEYCPVCSFTGMTNLNNTFYDLDKLENLSPDIVESLNSLQTFFLYIKNMHLTFKTVYMPIIVYYDGSDTAEIKILSMKNTEAELLLSKLIEHIKVDGTSISDINSFSFKVSKNTEANSFDFDIVDIEEHKLKKEDYYYLIQKTKQELLKLNVKKIIFSSKEKQALYMSQLNQIYDKVVNSLRDEIEKIYHLF